MIRQLKIDHVCVEPRSVSWSAVIVLDGACSECGRTMDDQHSQTCRVRATVWAAPPVTADGKPVTDDERVAISALLASALTRNDWMGVVTADSERVERHCRDSRGIGEPTAPTDPLDAIFPSP